MTATNHAFTGALIALAVKQPLVAIPLAFMSHFLLDSIPHFGIHEDNAVKRNGHPVFRTVVTADTMLTVVLFILLPLTVHRGVSGWTIALAMFAAILPDSIWIYRFVHEVRFKRIRPQGWFARWHQKIQWKEKPWGLSIEFAWAALLTVVLALT